MCVGIKFGGLALKSTTININLAVCNLFLYKCLYIHVTDVKFGDLFCQEYMIKERREY